MSTKGTKGMDTKSTRATATTVMGMAKARKKRPAATTTSLITDTATSSTHM
jgi:hypothetical protein